MEKKKGISGSTLKMIAIVTMLIDHIGAAVLARLLMVNGLGELDQTNTDAIMQWSDVWRSQSFAFCWWRDFCIHMM